MNERRRNFWLAILAGVIATILAGILVPAPHDEFMRLWNDAVHHGQPGPGTQNPLGYDSVVDTKYLTQGRYYYCHGTCDIPLRTGPSVDAPALAETVHYPTAHAISGHTYHSLCQTSGGSVQDDRGVKSRVWAFIEVEGGYRGWISEVWFGWNGIQTPCSGVNLGGSK
jgi:hypothetical protein